MTWSAVVPWEGNESYGYLETTTINAVLRAKRVNDALGRTTTYTEYSPQAALSFSQASTYDRDNRITDQTLTQLQSNNSYVISTIHNDYRLAVGAAYTGADQGVITHSTTQQQGSAVVQTTNYSYAWWDEAKQTTITVTGSDPQNPNATNWAPGASQLSYDVNGHLASAIVTGGTTSTITYTNDAYGQVLERETRSGSTIGLRQLYYYLDGHRIGDVGNQGPSRVDYASALAARASTASADFRGAKPVASADFDENYEPIGANYPAQASSAYTVRTGDTLSSIAQSVWGDSSLWYLIADANGLTASDPLVAGQTVSIPNKVANIHNRAGVYRVYDPGEAIGDTLPTLPVEPAPPAASAGNNCGAFGAILLVVVAVAVEAIVGPAIIGAPAVLGTATAEGSVATGLTAALGGSAAAAGSAAAIGAGVIGGALAGAAGSVVSQVFGVATGIQDAFSFKNVALAAIAGGIGGGLGGSNILKGASGIDKVHRAQPAERSAAA